MIANDEIEASGGFLVAWDWHGTPVWKTPDGFLTCDEREVYALVRAGRGRFAAWQPYAQAEALKGTKTRQASPVVFRVTAPGQWSQYAIQVRDGRRSWWSCGRRSWSHRCNVFAYSEAEAVRVAALAGQVFTVQPRHVRAVRLQK